MSPPLEATAVAPARRTGGASYTPAPGGPAADPRCLNCDTPLGGPFCAQCGQRDAPHEPSARELMTDAIQELVNVDGKLLATLRALLHPGRLSAELAAGRVVRRPSPSAAP